MNASTTPTYEFVRATFSAGGREYTYKAKLDELVPGDEAVTNTGKSVTVVAVKTGPAIVNGRPYDINFYGWVERKPTEAPDNAQQRTP
jgi:hypothetical protein